MKHETNAVIRLREAVEWRIKKMDHYYNLSSKERVSDPEVSDMHARLGDEMLGQIEAIREVSLIFGYRFDIIDAYPDKGSKMSEVRRLR